MQIIVHPSQSLTRLLQDFRDAGTEFLLLLGVHESLGSWAFADWLVLAPGCTLRGAGRGKTTLRLAANPTRNWNGAPHGDRSLNPLWVGKGCTIEDLDIDGNEEAFRDADPAKRWFVASGIRCKGGRLTVRNVGICGLRGELRPVGTQAIDIESFGVSTFDDADGGNLIEDVEFWGVPKSSYFSAVFIGAAVGPNGEPPARSYVRRIRSCVGEGNWLGIAAGVNVEFEDIELSGHIVAVYNDTGETRDVAIRRLRAFGVSKALSLVAKAASPLRGVVVEDSEFTFAADPTPKYAAEVWDQTGSTACGDVIFSRCRFFSTEGDFFLWSAACSKLRPLRFDDCTLPDKAKKSYGPGTPTNRVSVRGAMTASGSPYAQAIA